MDCSKNERPTNPFMEFSKLRVKVLHFMDTFCYILQKKKQRKKKKRLVMVKRKLKLRRK